MAFTPTNLLYQGGPVNALTLRLNHGGTTNALSANTQWVDTFATKNIMTGLAVGQSFRVAACCYSAAGADTFWSGTLSY